MRKHSLTIAFGVAGFLLATAASAAAPTGRSTAALQLRDGTDGAISKLFDAQPRSAGGVRGLRTLSSDLGGRVQGMWTSATGVPSYLWGFSVPVSRGADAARKTASSTLERHVALLAPGAAASDFTLAAEGVEASTGLGRVVFQQTWRGLPVLGAAVSMSFKNDRLFAIGSRAVPDVSATMPATFITAEVARASAQAWVAEESARASAADVAGPFVLPFDDHGKLAFRVVMSVRVDAAQPVGRFDVFVDAATGEALARRQLLMFETAQLELAAWERSPSFGERLNYPADRVPLSLGGAQATGECSPEGDFSFEEGEANGTATLKGSHVDVTNAAEGGENASFAFEAEAGGSLLWSESTDEQRDAQVVAYVHGDIANAYARTFAPELEFLDDPVTIFVNENDVCNAFSDGTEIHFFASGSGCENTARIADVVYHEYGHSLHCHTYQSNIINEYCIPDGALSEGTSDYFAATITGDHGMGRGFFYDTSPLRDVDPEQDRVWPNDLVGEAHYDGEIIGGTLWDLRKALIEELGEEDGVALADRLFHETLKHAHDIPSMYPEMLLVDDDDGDLANGTPNQCVINSVFARHGLRPVDTTTAIPAVTPPTQAGADVAIGFQGLSEVCGESLTDAFVTWTDSQDPSLTGTIPMTLREDGLVHATIPTKRDGQVIEFSVEVGSPNGVLHFPQNAADPEYQLYVGDVTPIYCTDFETDPFNAPVGVPAWAHELVSGVDEVGADDWMWGPPGGDGLNGDPMVAFGGNNVVGQDLSPEQGEQRWDGQYKPDRHTALVSPVIQAGGYGNVRLQYRRWLNVEDAHFDQATIMANGALAWQNLDSDRGDEGSNVQHQDREWRFHDVDITPFLADDGSVQLRFEMKSDGGLQFGGWTIDDVCVVGVKAGECPPGKQCAPTPSPAGPIAPSNQASSGGGDDAEADADDGCNCEVRGATRSTSPAALVGLAAVAAFAARRRRRG